MSERKRIKDASEGARGDRFLEWLARDVGAKFTVIGRPEPPDILFTDARSTSWLELAEIFRSPEEAREQYSRVTPGELR